MDIVLDKTPTNTISRRHAEIFARKGRGGALTYVLRDLVSARALVSVASGDLFGCLGLWSFDENEHVVL